VSNSAKPRISPPPVDGDNIKPRQGKSERVAGPAG
jgi:hypothetical protein